MQNSLVWLELVDLLDVDGKTTCSVQSSWAHIALEVFCLLMLHEN